MLRCPQLLEGLCRKAHSLVASRRTSRRVSYRAPPAPLPTDEPLSVSIRKALLAIRTCVFKRGAYLESLRAPSTLRADAPVPLDLEGEGNGLEVEVPDITTGASVEKDALCSCWGEPSRRRVVLPTMTAPGQAP
jgi:hypothetical protein